MQTATLVNIQLKKEDQLKPNELWHFDWDNDTVETHDRASEMTDEQIQAHNARLAAML